MKPSQMKRYFALLIGENPVGAAGNLAQKVFGALK